MKNLDSFPPIFVRKVSAWRTICGAAACLMLLAGAISARGQAIQIKAANGSALDAGASWFSGTVPGTNDIAEWNSVATATGDSLTSMGGAFSVGEIEINSNVVGAVSIADATTADVLTLNGVTGTGVAIDMSAATQNLTLGTPLNIGGNQVWNITNGRTLTIAGVNNPQFGTNVVTVIGGGTLAYNPFSSPTTAASSAAGAGLIISNSVLTARVQATTSANYANYFGANTALTMANSTFTAGAAANSGHATQTFARLTLGAGTSLFAFTARQSSSGNCVGFAALARNAGAMADFGANSSASTAWGPNNQEAFGLPGATVLGYATYAANDWVLPAGSNTVLAVPVYVNDTWAAGNNTTVTQDDAPAAGATVNSLRFNANGAFTVTLTGTNTITTGGILVGVGADANASTITGGTLISGNTTADGLHDLIVINNNSTDGSILVINSILADNGVNAVGLTVGATAAMPGGPVQLGAANTFSGTTYITAGALQLNHAMALSNSTFNTSLPGTLDLSLLTAATLGGLSGTGNLALPAGFVLSVGNNNANTTYGGMLSGSGATLSKVGAGTLTLTNANTYSGGTVLAGGTLSFAGSPALSLGTGGVTFNGGALQWAAGNTNDISAQTVTVNSGGGTIDLNGNTVTFAGPIGNGGTGGLMVVSTGGAGVLNLNGVNNYKGLTTIGAGVTLGGGGSVAGSVTVNSGGQTLPGAVGLTNTIGGNLTYAGGASANFYLGPLVNGPGNDRIVLSGTGVTLNCGGVDINNIGIHCGSVLDTGHDYVLFKLTANGSIAGNFNVGPVWLGTTPANANFFQVQASNGNVVLHYNGVARPSITAASATPNPVVDLQTVFIAATAAQGSDPNGLGAVTVNLTPLGGAAAQPLVSDGVGDFTNSTVVPYTVLPGVYSLIVTATDTAAQPNSSNTTISLTVMAAPAPAETWNGADFARSPNWSDGTNWAGALGPGFGDSIYFDGAAGPAPVMNQTYSLASVTFNSGAGSFNISGTGGVLFLTNGMTNNSPSLQTWNVPVVINATLPVVAGAGGLNLAGAISGSGGLTTVGAGMLALSGSNTYAGPTTINAGVVRISSEGATGGNAGNLGMVPGAATTNDVILAGGDLLGTGAVALSSNRGIGIGAAAGGTGTNGLIDAAAGAMFTVNGIIASAGNSGTNNLVLNSLAGSSGNVVLGGTNTFTGTIVIDNGTLTVGVPGALQAGVVNYNNQGGVLNFGTNSSVAFGALTGSQGLALANATNGPVALSLGANNADSAYSGNFSGPGSLTKTGAGTLVLTGSNNIAGGAAAAGILEVTNGGVLSVGGSINSTATFAVAAGGVVNAAGIGLIAPSSGIVVSGGSLTNTGAALFTNSATAFLETAGYVQLQTCNGAFNSDGTLIEITGGTFTAASVDMWRTAASTTAPTAAAPTAAPTSSGFYVNSTNTSAPAVVNLDSIAFGDDNSSGSMRVDAGAVTVTNQVKVGATAPTAASYSVLQINGGTFTNLDTNFGIVIAQNGATNGNPALGATDAEVYLSGGTTTAGIINFGLPTDTNSGAGFLIISNASLFMGSGGIQLSNTHGYAATIALTKGTLGAVAPWASSLPMQINGTNFTFQTADGSGHAWNIRLGGALSGTGSLIQTGGGILTLSGNNTYTGSTMIGGGGFLALAGGGLLGNGSYAGTVNNAGTFNFGGTNQQKLSGTLNGAGVLVQSGSNTLTLAGTNNFSGAITVNNGALALVGDGQSTGILLNTSAIAVNSPGALDPTGLSYDGALHVGDQGLLEAAQSLSGNGTINGSVVIGNVGTLSPGPAQGAYGNLTITGMLTVKNIINLHVDHLAGGATNDAVTAQSISVAAGATINVQQGTNDLSAGDTFHLFNCTNLSLNPGHITLNLPATAPVSGTNYVWNTNNLAVNGTLALVPAAAVVNQTATNISFNLATPGHITIGWPSNQTGWRLLMQSNSTGAGLLTNLSAWTTVAGSTNVNQEVFPIGATNEVFFELVYP